MPTNGLLFKDKDTVQLIIFVALVDHYILEMLKYFLEKSSGPWEYETTPAVVGTFVFAKLNYKGYFDLVRRLNNHHLVLKPRVGSNFVIELVNG